MRTPSKSYLADFHIQTTRLKEDIDAVRASYPYIVQRTTKETVSEEIGDWFVSLGGDMLVISKIRIGPVVNFGPWIITYGFKYEADATAFKLRFV